MTKNNLRVVVLAHVFPRTLDDSMGAFLLHLGEGLAARAVTIAVVAPHAAQLAREETLAQVDVHRFQYAPARWEHLAYRGTMHELVAGGIGNKILFAMFNLAFLFKTLAVVWSAQPQILHAHWGLPDGLVGALASRITRKPLILTTHGTDVEILRRTRWATRIARWVFARARAITCGSNYLREQLIALKVADAKKISVVPMPVNPMFERSAVRGQRSANQILTVARLTKQKRIDTLIAAIALLPDARLHIIGDGPERANLEAQVRQLGLQNRVKFLGALPQTELPQHYAECAAFVLPSIREGMGLVFAEALLCGAPVIAANSGGVTDIVRDGETGLLVPEQDATALAEAIQKILRDQVLAQRLAENGATFVREHYVRECVVEQFVQIYQGVLNA
jgi:glycosyltransferase involved in cell wall biosynthesis